METEYTTGRIKRNIKLFCIDRYNGFKIQEVFGDKEAEWERVPEFGGRSDRMNMRLSRHMIREHEENRTTWLSIA